MIDAVRRLARNSKARLMVLAGLGALSMSACASVTPQPIALTGAAPNSAHHTYARAASTHAAVGQTGARYKTGAPYQAGGVWYVPAAQPDYNEVGIASWYGDQFNGKPTADGERFDMSALTAAHATLPIPCMVEVTNLENGRSIQVRVNDRGPFHPARIIDMSRGAAQALGFFGKGTAQVRVRYVGPASLADAPLQYAANTASSPFAQAAAPPSPFMQASFDRPAPSTGGYSIQAGAFAARENAERAAAHLAAAGKTSISPVDRGTGRLYRVTVGRWSDAESASSALGQIAALGFGGAKVVPGS